MLRLTYRTEVFGPLHFEYAKRRIRVGSCRDNDLVLPHPSVQPYHCVLDLDEEWLAVLEPNAPDDAPVDDRPRMGPGDRLQVGELIVEIDRSPNSVGIAAPTETSVPEGLTAEGYWMATAPDIPATARWHCRNCNYRYEDSHVRTVGLVGRKTHLLCPLCSGHVIFFQPGPANPKSLGEKFKRGWKRFLKLLGF